MNNSIKWSIIGAIVVTIVLVLLVPTMLRDPDNAGVDTAGQVDQPLPGLVGDLAPNRKEVPTDVRPACSGQGAAGVELPCLGAENGEVPADANPASTQASVINLWAWWCEPCRDELPIFDEFANAHPEYTVVGVHADAYPASGVDMLEGLDVDLPSYQDDDNIFAGTLGLPGVVPITIISVDGEHTAVFAQTFRSVEELEEKVAEALN